MSGGSFDYLYAKDASSLLDCGDRSLQDMADALAREGFEDAARETQGTLLEIRQARVRIQARIDRLEKVWKAMEWWKSNDGTREDVERALRAYRGEPEEGA